MASIDIKDAYYSVPIAPEHRKYGSSRRANSFSIPAFPMLKPAYASLKQTGDEIVPYIDDSYLQGDTEQEC